MSEVISVDGGKLERVLRLNLTIGFVFGFVVGLLVAAAIDIAVLF